ncbi:pilus (MSHA type) biogenesis protein MshL [Aquabacterium fontiphilum]|nr:pilus (MSHA type) biogenesis protein MshL [Aquabacterium fontiphilum]
MVGISQGGVHAGADRLSFTLTSVPAAARVVAAAPAELAQVTQGDADSPVVQRVAPRPSPAVRGPAPATAPAPEARFDIAVHEAPAAQVFLQMGLNGSYSMLVSPEVTGNVTLKLRQTTVPEALEALRELYGYDYRIASGNRVFVYPNTVQTRLFRISYLPGRRQGASDLRVNSNFVMQASSGGSGGGSAAAAAGGANAGSADTTAVRMTTDTNFWQDVQDSLKSMLGGREGRNITLNPGAGVIVVRATPSELRQVADYLRAVQLTIERQVMLEAKIIEVRLSDSSQMGVNWSLFRQVSVNGNRGTVGTVGVTPGTTLSNSGALTNANGSVLPNALATADALGKGFYGLAFQSASFAALVSFLETQGDVRVLSSPRIATINNQKAVLKVGRDELFVTNITTNQTSNGNTTTSSPTVTLQPFFSGIALDVTPQIDDNGTVMLHVHPTVSVVTERQKPIDLGTLGRYTLPLASSSINETDSIVRVRDGEVVAIGGLMQQDSSSDRSGVPGLSEAPVVGGLFRQRSSSRSKYELVILIKPTIVSDDGGTWPQPQGVAAADVTEATGQR